MNYLVLETAASGFQQIKIALTKTLLEAQEIAEAYLDKYPKHELVTIWDGKNYLFSVGSCLSLEPWSGDRIRRYIRRKQDIEGKP